MELINPNILWGLLAISAPILIHFWNQKKAVTIDWAAMKWLIESQKLKAKGLRLDDLLLLLLRILAMILLVLILSKPLINKLLPKKKNLEKIHFFQKNKTLFENFKFEFSDAIQKKEKVFWLNDLENTIKKTEENLNNNNIQIAYIQTNINILQKKYPEKEIHIYTNHPVDLNLYPNIYLTENLKLHPLKTESENNTKALFFGQYVYVNKKNALVRTNEKPEKKVIDKGDIKVFIDDNKTLKAAFEAIKEVFGFPFEYVQKKEAAEIIFNQNSVYHTIEFKTDGNLETQEIILDLNPETSNIIFNGKLPEIILEILLNHYQISDKNTLISNQQLASIFKTKQSENKTKKMAIDKYLLFLFLGIIMAERYLSLKQNK
ncbi:hypothetical protein EGI22_16360 [Lacihabitans sp. LS3-19]|uniref:BatA domain-containing protein n=1 Tax=Lacihabitans sp. LS3-19 TaxID=2487335 RepID=UPI0020CE2730|nr:BatA domain-containing protein [Lacihabitans sp. LS3-19]MCP9769478.1 hypothetical protein [Lacihabitans sp. LS3-19]